MFGSVFRFSHLKTVVFRSWVLSRLAGFLEFSLWFSVLSTMMAVFQVFCPVYFNKSITTPPDTRTIFTFLFVELTFRNFLPVSKDQLIITR